MKKTNRRRPNPVESLEYIKCYSFSSTRPIVVPDLIKVLAIPSATDREDLKPYCKSDKRPYFSRRSASLLFTSFPKTLLTIERKLTGQLFVAAELFPAFLNSGSTNETFQQSEKQESFQYILKSSAGMYESPEHSLEPPLKYNQDQKPLINQGYYDLFNHPRCYKNIMQFQISFKGKTGEEIAASSRIEFLEKFLANNFALSDTLLSH